jgi:hypothetical protein
MTIAAGTTYTLVFNVDVAALTLTAWVNGTSVILPLPSGFVLDAPSFDWVLSANDYSTANAFKGTWDWVFATNGLLSYNEVTAIATAHGL